MQPGAVHALLDSWTVVKSAGTAYVPGTLRAALARLLSLAVSAPFPVFLSVYFDPAHVAALPEFDACLDDIAEQKHRVWTGTYAQAAQALD
jgi:hypothetical protein